MRRIACSFLALPALFLFLSLCGATAPDAFAAAGDERILLFDASAVFDPDGTMEMTETITVRATGNQISRGIFRTLPRIWRRADGKRFRLTYDIHSVTRGGKAENYTVSQTDEWVTIRMGRKSVRLQPGEYTYAVTYTVRNHFSRFPEWDELYWNVTGNEWAFAIDKARFRLLFRESPDALPAPMPMRSLDLYTGRLDEQGDKAHRLPDGTVETTAPLARGEGLTIAWTWPRGVLFAAPDPEEYSLLRTLFLPTSQTVLLWLVPLWLAGYFLLVRLIKSPGAAPEVIPLFRVPEGFTPGALRYVMKKKYDATSFAADLLNLVAKGAASLNSKAERPVLKLGGHGRKALQAEEREALDRVFAGSRSVSLTQSNNGKFRKARQGLFNRCKEEKKLLFQGVTLYAVLGILQAFALPVCAARFFAYAEAPVLTFMMVFSCIWVGILLLFTWVIWADISGVAGFFGRLPFMVFLLPFWAAIIGLWVTAAPDMLITPSMPEGFVSAFLLTVLACWVGIACLPRWTAEGLRRLSIAKGLALYLGTAERERFAMLYPPEESVEHFEELLPYALALDKGKTWANRFQKYMEEAGAASAVYAAKPWDTVKVFRSGVTRASVSPRSSSRSGSSSGGFSGSGSSGGGSSGRGAGGGGGGGW